MIGKPLVIKARGSCTSMGVGTKRRRLLIPGKRAFRGLAIIAAGLMLGLIFLAASGCGSRKLSRLEVDYGTSFMLARFNQTLNPRAGERPGPALGLDGQVASKIVDGYRREFEKRQSAAGAESVQALVAGK